MTTTAGRPPLVRPRAAFLGGVATALAAHLRWPVATVRCFFLGLTLAGGAGPLLYAWLWALTPLEAARQTVVPIRRRVPVSAALAGVGAAAFVVQNAALVRGNEALATWALAWVCVASTSAFAWNLSLDRADAARTARYGLRVRIAAVALLVLAGAVAVAARPSAVNAVLGVFALVLGVAVLAAPRAVALWQDLLGERSARARQEQRAEMAAHLHDSVLQTLALIQTRAGASSEVARIARAQERELRDWLFVQDSPVAADLAAEIRQTAAAIELDHAVHIDIVTVGDPVAANPALVAATREAMLNAARHAGGEVSVYLESRAGTIDVFVRDRGPGVDLTTVPSDRLGIRESIIGRMTRAGGSATLSSRGEGTEVHLQVKVPT